MSILEVRYDYEAIFKERPNRYLAVVDIPELNLKDELVHVHDPGRLKELLYTDNKVYIKKASNPNRKTSWDVLFAKKGEEKVLINSSYHRYLSEAIIKNEDINPFKEVIDYKPEVKKLNSRFDYLLKTNIEEIFVEVKGCSLSENNIAMFPDAPTKRGTRHVKELIELKESGINGNNNFGTFKGGLF